MIPNPDQLDAISHMREGSLAEIPFAVLLHALASRRKSAVLEIDRKPLKKEIFLEDGVPIDCRSNLLHETLGRFMVSRNDISEEIYQDCLAKSAARGLQFGEVLILEGLINASELYKVLQQNLAKKLLDGFTWRTGDFRLLNQPPSLESTLKVNSAQLVVTGITKFALDGEVNEAVGPLVGKRLFIHPAPTWSLDEIRLSATERRLTSLLFRGKRIDEMAAETTIPFDKIMRLLYALAVIGIVVPEDRMPDEVSTETAGGEQTPPVAEDVAVEEQLPAVEIDEEELDKERNQVMEAYLQHRKQDAFDLLGLSEQASMQQIERKFVEFCRRFAPWNFEVPGLWNLVEKAEDLFVAGGRAFGELADAERRNTLIHRRRTLREEASRKGNPERFAIKSQLLDPEVQFAKGTALMQAGDYREAVQQLQFACDCDPQNTTYRAELAYCRFLLAPSQEAERSLEDLREARRIDPKGGLAVYYTGMICGEIGRFDEAEAHLRKSIRLLMPDRRPIEGLKALQKRRK